jgi:hypothetical protein
VISKFHGLCKLQKNGYKKSHIPKGVAFLIYRII